MSLLVICSGSGYATDYFFHVSQGTDTNTGTTISSPWQSLAQLSEITLKAGDRVLLAEGEHFRGNISLFDVNGTEQMPVIITSYRVSNEPKAKPIIDAKGLEAGIAVVDSRYIEISDIQIMADGGTIKRSVELAQRLKERKFKSMRVGILVMSIRRGVYHGIKIDNVEVKDVFANNAGTTRSYAETSSANGTEEYGFGIYTISYDGTELHDVSITNSVIRDISHTGIKFKGKKSIVNALVKRNKIRDSGGPGIQMSGVVKSVVSYNVVNRPGSNKDGRNWARGSGMWTWGSDSIIVEQNQFLNANGPGDSAGFHIDFNCKNIIVQYNLSVNNAGGFIEILGNNYNNTYRYNVSVNDGHRIKQKGVAFQEGKTLWLSGFVGVGRKGKTTRPRKRHGPYNTYIYNNTIYVKEEITARIAVTRVAEGAFIANNIFHIMGDSAMVKGDQYAPESDSDAINLKNVVFTNNLFLKQTNWPRQVLIQDQAPLFGNAEFTRPGGIELTDYIPQNVELIADKGIAIALIPGDRDGLIVALDAQTDILGNPIVGKPDLGAIEINFSEK